MKSSILIVAEGEHELTGNRPDPALTTLVRRLLGDGIDVQASVKRSREVAGHTHAGKGDRLGRKFIGIVQFAEREGCPTGFSVFADRVSGLKSALSRDF